MNEFILIEDWTPYDRSLRWTLQDLYFNRRGHAAWLEGDMPFFGLNNPVIARQHARLLVGLVDELEASGRLLAHQPIGLLEIGAGLGVFAGYLFEALSRGPARARRVLERLTYVLSDGTATTVEQALRRPEMMEAVEQGRVIPALLDLRKPLELASLSGKPIEVPLVACVANYVACVTPLKLIRKADGRFYEQYARVEAREPLSRLMERSDQPKLFDELRVLLEWRPVELAHLFQDPRHAETIERLARPFAEATIPYPYVFLDAVLALSSRMLPGGLALMNDFGSAALSDLAGNAAVEPEHYGNSLAHEVHSGVIAAYCRAAGLAVARVREPLRSIQTVAIRFQAEMLPSFRRLFSRTYERHQEGEDMIDFTEAAARLLEHGEYRLALRLYQRCVAQAPGDPELLYRLGKCCVELGHPEIALRYLKRGVQLPGAEDYRFESLIERARREWRFRLGTSPETG